MTEYRKHGSTASDENLRNYIFRDIDLTGKRVLNVGCGNDYVEGWVNLDGDPTVKSDIKFDLERVTDFYAPIDDNTKFDIIYASHILEHIHNLVQVKKELTQLLKPKGIMIVVVPDYLSPDAWGDDTHCRAFSKESFLLSFWPGFIEGKIQELAVEKQMGTCKWLIAYLTKEDDS